MHFEEMFDVNMYWLDVVILVLLGLGAILGFWSGFFWQVSRVANLALAAYLCVIGNDWATERLRDAGMESMDVQIVRILAYGLVFIGSFLIGRIAIHFCHRLLQESPLALLDRGMGAIVGLSKMVLLIAGACSILAWVSLPITQEWMDNSQLAPHFAKGTEAIVEWMPEHHKDQARSAFADAKDFLGRTLADQALGKKADPK